MFWIVVGVVAAVGILIALLVKVRQARNAREFERTSVDAEVLRQLLEKEPPVLLYDVRLPLDLLAYSEMIPGAKRLSPKEVLANPALIPADQDVVLYCTCEAQKTSLEIVRKAKGLGFSRLKVLRGGLAGWKSKGYPVEVYRESFRLDTAV